MLSLNTLVGRMAADFTREERLGLLKALHDLANIDGNYVLIEKIGLESIAALLFPQDGEDIQAMEDSMESLPLETITSSEKQHVVMDAMCFTALSDDRIHPGEVDLIARYASAWGFTIEEIRQLSCFDPINLLEQGLSGAGEQLLDSLRSRF